MRWLWYLASEADIQWPPNSCERLLSEGWDIRSTAHAKEISLPKCRFRLPHFNVVKTVPS